MTTQLELRWISADQADDAALARLAAEFAGVDGSGVRVVRACRSCGSDSHGKPQVLRLDGGGTIYVSLSRSARQAVLAVTDAGPVGVDIEVDSPPAATTWTRVESVVKATGHGLQIDPDSVAVTPPSLEPEILVWPGQPIGNPVWMYQLDAPPGFTACASVISTEQPRLVPPTAALGA